MYIYIYIIGYDQVQSPSLRPVTTTRAPIGGPKSGASARPAAGRLGRRQLPLGRPHLVSG